jgi:Na+-driven multidrug efflux pump
VIARPAYIPVFSDDPAVRDLVWSLAVVVAASQPVGAVLYVLDGILIGAGDLGYLAWSMLGALLVFVPLAAAVYVADAGVVALWWALTGWLLTRQIAVALRYG